MKTEAQIQKECNSFLRARGWHVERFTGNAFQKGIPDVQLFHLDHGFRWVDYKRTKGGVLTRAQRIKWPQWEAAGIGIWILTSTEDYDDGILFRDPNWRKWWKPSYDIDIDKLLDEVTLE